MAGDIGIWQDELGPPAGDRTKAARRRVRPPSGWLRRAMVPAGHYGPRHLAIGLTVVGAGAFAASLIADWQRVTFAQQDGEVNIRRTLEFAGEVASRVGDLDLFGTVYLVGVIGLLAAAAAAIGRAEHAARLRFPVIGGGLGLVAMLVAVALRASTERLDMKRSVLDQLTMSYGYDDEGNLLSITGAAPPTFSVGAGLLLAFAAVLLPLGAVWFASRATPPQEYAAPAAPAAADPDAVEDTGPDLIEAGDTSVWRPRDPYDLTVTPS
ncbi:hypothetical protein [Luedemannella helvata]|uniref:hypothetical protein n=1 Tax=Luedemannella helvata TaxID=349315 RepID=UPI0031D8568D